MNFKIRAHDALHRLKVDVVPYNGTYFLARRRVEILREFTVDLVVDVGANEGQFGRCLRREGYRRSIASFEPLSDVYEQLATIRDESWCAYRLALGATTGTAKLNRSLNSWSSSVLPITARHVEASPDSAYVGTEEVEMRALDSFGFDGRIYLKIDAQGFELAVLEGARQMLKRAVVGLELELSTAPLYDGQPLMGEMLEVAQAYGFAVFALSPSFIDPQTKEILQFDGVFAKTKAIDSFDASSLSPNILPPELRNEVFR
jgi:FkbM family methyltransferase